MKKNVLCTAFIQGRQGPLMAAKLTSVSSDGFKRGVLIVFSALLLASLCLSCEDRQSRHSVQQEKTLPDQRPHLQTSSDHITIPAAQAAFANLSEDFNIPHQ